MKFIADAMLGRLAKWMRITGCDVIYNPVIGDRDLVSLALKEDRMILTRDTLLITRRAARDRCFLVRGDGFKEQLKQVLQHFSIDPYAGLLTRCIACNIRLTGIEREKVRGAVPAFVYEGQEAFQVCQGCGRIYWPATHKQEILKTLEEISDAGLS